MAEREALEVGRGSTDPIADSTPGHYGAAASGLTIAELPIAAAWNVQGDATRRDFVAETRRLFDIDLPVRANTSERSPTLAALWLGPKSWLLVAGGASALTGFSARRDALNAFGGALFDVSAGRVAWSLAGASAASVLAKACPLDFHPRAFAVGACAQSVYGHVSVLIERRGDSAFTLMAARSFARGVAHALGVAAAQYGYDVIAPQPYG